MAEGGTLEAISCDGLALKERGNRLFAHIQEITSDPRLTLKRPLQPPYVMALPGAGCTDHAPVRHMMPTCIDGRTLPNRCFPFAARFCSVAEAAGSLEPWLALWIRPQRMLRGLNSGAP